MARQVLLVAAVALLVLATVADQAVLAESNLARTATASAEALYSPAPYYSGWEPSLATDGNMSTRWSAYPDNDYADQKFILEWSTPQVINRVVIYQAWELMTQFLVEYWDGLDWQIAQDFGDPTTTRVEGVFDQPVTTTKLRISNPVTDYEIEAWGEGTTQGVMGYVTCLESGKGLAGVKVSSQGVATATSTDGSYLLVLPTAGSTEVTVEKGVVFAKDTVVVPEGNTAQLDFMVPTYNLAFAATPSSSSEETTGGLGPANAINGIYTDRFVFDWTTNPQTGLPNDPERWFQLDWPEPVSSNIIQFRQWDACCQTTNLRIQAGTRPTNLARSSTATSSSQEGSGTGPELAIDGDHTNRFVFDWHEGVDPLRWLQLEWTEPVTFNTIKLRQWDACCQTTNLKIEAWNEGSASFAEVTTAAIDPLLATITIPSQTTKKLRVSDPALTVVMEIEVTNDDGAWLQDVTTATIAPVNATITIPTQTATTLRVSDPALTVIMEIELYNSVSLSGNVTNTATGAPISYVNIEGGFAPVLSGNGSRGAYTTGTPVGDITLRASKRLFDSVQVPVSVPAGGLAGKDFTMTGPTDLVPLASGATASQAAEGHEPAMGIDGDSTTYWSTTGDNRTEQFIIEWPTEQPVDTVIVPAGAFYSMQVDIWRDGGWINMGMDGDTLSLSHSGFVQFAPRLTTKVRLRNLLRIDDVEVYNVNGTAPAENLRGTVRNAYSGKPVVGATVTADGQSTVTSSVGRFYLTLPAGATTVSVSRQGYDAASKQVTVPETGFVDVSFDLTTANIATLATAKASASMAGYPPSLANDDDYGTRWSQYPDNSYGSDWFELDWPFEVTLTGVADHEFGGWVSQFRAYYWDGSAWQLAGQQSAPFSLDIALTFPSPVTTKKLRMFTPITSWEIEAFGHAAVGSVAEAKMLPDGAFVSFSGTTTAVFDDAGYVEKSDRTSGIRVQPATGFGSVGDLATVSGVVGTAGLERVIYAQQVTSGPSDPLTPVGMPNRSLSTADSRGVQLSTSYSGNMAADGIATASASEPDMPPGLAVDRNMDTMWATTIDGDYANDWFQIDWSSSVTLTGLKVYQALVEGTVPMPHLRAYYWNGSDWQLAGQYGDGATEPPADVELTFAAPITTNRLRVFSPVAAWEIEVYGSGTQPALAAGPISTVGILITTWGRVVATAPAAGGAKYLYVDDGSLVASDLTGVYALKVGPVVTTKVTGDFVSVTGVSRVVDAGGVPIRLVQPRSSADVR